MKGVPHIFIVEDSIMVQQMIELNLKDNFECRVSKFVNINDALGALKKETPDIVLLDYMLEAGNKLGKTGLDFMKALRRLKIKIPTIVFSGQKEKSVAVDLIRHGAVDYVSKDSDSFHEDLIKSVGTVRNMLTLTGEYSEEEEKKRKFLRKFVALTLVSIISIIIISVFLK